MNEYVLEPIGTIRSELKNTEDAPCFIQREPRTPILN